MGALGPLLLVANQTSRKDPIALAVLGSSKTDVSRSRLKAVAGQGFGKFALVEVWMLNEAQTNLPRGYIQGATPTTPFQGIDLSKVKLNLTLKRD